MVKLVMILLSLFLPMPQQETPTQVMEDDRPTRFEISLDKTVYFVGEPVEITMTLYNDGEQTIQGRYYLGLGNIATEVYYRKAGEEMIRFYSGWMRAEHRSHGVMVVPIKIEPQGKWEVTNRVWYNTSIEQFVLADPGEYEFQATFSVKQPLHKSNIVRVKVVEPPDGERAALAALSDPVLAQFVEGDLQLQLVEPVKVEAGAEKAAAFLAKYSRSIYAPAVEDQLKWVLTKAPPGRLTPKLQALRERLPDQ